MLEKGFSSSNIFQQINHKLVLINGLPVRDKNVVVKAGEIINIKLLPEVNDLLLNSEDINVVYEDDFLLIVDKPTNLLVEPYKNNTNNNLASMVANYFLKQEIMSKVHLVNRLDKCTSGLIVIAKNRYIKNVLTKTKICKKYLAKIEGKIPPYGTIKINIDKEPFSNSRIISQNGKESITKYETISYDEKSNVSTAEVEIITGRTHQIRLSFSSIGHPLVGDELYGSSRKESIFLRAYYLEFVHPITGEKITIEKAW